MVKENKMENKDLKIIDGGTVVVKKGTIDEENLKKLEKTFNVVLVNGAPSDIIRLS